MPDLPFTAFDYGLISVLAFSALVGALRGLLREAMSLVVWVTALWVAGHYDTWLAPQLAGIFNNDVLRDWAARALLLLAVLVGGGLVTWLATLLLAGTRLSALDRSVGFAFGVIRGVVLAGLVVILLELAGLDRESWWRESKLLPYAAAVADVLRDAAAPASLSIS
jgi:membrane protein required for colicin V production